MQPLHYIEIIWGFLDVFHDSDFEIDIATFNSITRDLRIKGFHCTFDYLEMEIFARNHPNIATVNPSSIHFMPSSDWINYINHLNSLYLGGIYREKLKSSIKIAVNNE